MAEEGCDELYDYDGGDFIVYKGKAAPGTATTEEKWLIIKTNRNEDNYPTSDKCSDGKGDYKKIWDNRASYSY